MIQHIVLFTPKADLSGDEKTSFADLVLRTLRSSFYVSRCTIGRRIQVNPGYERSFGDATYEYAAVMEFASEGALIAYLNDPAHAALGRAFWASCERTVVCEVLAAEVEAAAAEELVR